MIRKPIKRMHLHCIVQIWSSTCNH